MANTIDRKGKVILRPIIYHFLELFLYDTTYPFKPKEYNKAIHVDRRSCHQ